MKRCVVIIADPTPPPESQPAPPTWKPLELKPLKLKPFVFLSGDATRTKVARSPDENMPADEPLPYSAVSEDIEPAYAYVRPLTADMPKTRRKPTENKPAKRAVREPRAPRAFSPSSPCPPTGYYTDANGRHVARCDCFYVYTGGEAVECYASANITVAVCPRCKSGLVIANGTGWTPNKD